MKAESKKQEDALSPIQASLMVYATPPSLQPEVGRLYELSTSPNGTLVSHHKNADIQFALDGPLFMDLRIFRDREGTWHVENLENTSQVLINDLPTHQRELQDGDRIQVGLMTFRFLDGVGRESQFHQHLQRLIGTDALTGISNRRQLEQELLKALAYCYRAGRDFSLVLIDFDNFSKVNNTHGHQAGDQVLREMTARIKNNIRTEDIFGREGGEEFLIGLPGLSREKAAAFMERVRKKVTKDPIRVKRAALKITFSAGLAEWKKPTEIGGRKPKLEELAELTKLKQQADEKMYEAKAKGKNQVAY